MKEKNHYRYQVKTNDKQGWLNIQENEVPYYKSIKFELRSIMQICKTGCDNEPVIDVAFGNHTYNYCCIKGMQKSFDDFGKTLKPYKND